MVLQYYELEYYEKGTINENVASVLAGKHPYKKTLLFYIDVNLTIRVNPTKQESQQAQLERYFLRCISEPLPVNSAQSYARARAHGRADTKPITANEI